MIQASIDRPKLEKSLKRFAKDFGETNAQAICRWGVQTCREITSDTLPWKSKGNPRTQHKTAIERDLGRVVFVDDSPVRRKDNPRVLTTTEEVIGWMDANRTRNHRTRKLPPEKRKICRRPLFNKAVAALMKKAGIAKGGWLGAGQDIARAQKGSDRINIGKNFLSYAQKHSKFGESTAPREGFNPFAIIKNRASHTSSSYVITRSAIDRAVDFGLKKTLTWYRAALRKIDQKQP